MTPREARAEAAQWGWNNQERPEHETTIRDLLDPPEEVA